MRFIIGILLFPVRALMRVVRAYFRAANALNAFDLDLWLWHKVRWLKLDVLGRLLYLLAVFVLRTSFHLTFFLIRLSWRLTVQLARLLFRLTVFLVRLSWRLTIQLTRLLFRLTGKLCGLVFLGIPRLASLVVHIAPAVFWGVVDAAGYAALLLREAARGFAAGVYRVFQRGVGGVAAGALVVSGLYLILSPTWTELYRFNILFHLAVGILALAIVPRDYFMWLLKNFSALTFLRLFLVPVVLTAAVIFLPRAHETLLRSSLILAAFALLLFVNSIGLSKRRTGGGGRLEALLIQALMCLWFFEAATGAVIALNYESGAGWIFKYHRLAAYAFVGLIAARRLAVRRACDCPGCVRARYARAAVAAALAVVFAADAFIALPQQVIRVHASTGVVEKRTYFSSPRAGFETGALNVIRSCGEGAGCHAEIVADHLRSPHFRSHYTRHSCVFCHSVSGVHVDREKPSESFFTVAVRDRQMSFFLDGETGGEVARVEGRDRRLILLGRTGHARVFSRGPYKSDEFCAGCHRQIGSEGEETGGVGGLGSRMILFGQTSYARVFSRRLYRNDEFCASCHYHQLVSMNRPGRPYRRPKCIACHMQPRGMLGLEGKGAVRNHLFPGANRHFAAGEIRTAVPPGWDYAWDAVKYRSEALGRPAWFSMQIELRSGVTPGEEMRIRIFTTNNGLCHDLQASSLDHSEAWLEVIAKDAAGNVFFHSGGMGDDFRVDPAARRLGGVMGMDGLPVEAGRVIPSGQVVTDDYVFAAPEGIAGPISISARWRYRKLNQDFLDRAYPGSGKTALVATVASARLKARVEGSKVQRFKSSKVTEKADGAQTEAVF